MRAGDLIHRITIERPLETQGNLGQPKRDTWVAIRSNIAAKVEELSGTELFNAQQMQTDITTSVWLYWLPGITKLCRVNWHDGGANRQLHVLVPPRNPDGRRTWMNLLCKEAK